MFRRFALVGIVAAVTVIAPASTAHANKPLMLHTVEISPVGGGFICGDVALTATGGTQTEKVHAVVVNGFVHYNLVRSYKDLTYAGSDGVTYKAAASVHATAVLAAETGEPISVREVVQVTFGGLGYLHEVLVIDGDNEDSTLTGTCQYD